MGPPRPLPAWLAFSAWTVAILVSVPLVRPLQKWVAARVGSEVFGYVTLAGLAAAAVAAVLLMRRNRRTWRWPALLWLGGTAAVLVVWTVHLWQRPEEAIHFLQYGGLGVVAWLALRHHLDDAGVHLAAAALVSLVGLADEMLQWVVPSRIWDLRDVVLNACAGALAQVALAKAVAPPTAPVSRRSLRLTLRLVGVQLGLLVLCTANTPPRVERLVERVPALAFLRTNPDVMAEYGHLHRDPGIGVFRSRFDRAELDRLDRERGAEVGALVDRYPDHLYGDFLGRHTPVTDPFAHEVRVHLWSRDRNLDQALASSDPVAGTAAWRENQILETYFGRTLANSRGVWNSSRWAAAAAHLDPNLPFESKVSEHLITALSEGQVGGLLVAALLGVLALERWLSRKGAPR